MKEPETVSMAEQLPLVVIMAGGTGGHIFPGLATAKALIKKGYRVHWLGTPGSMEAELVPKYGIEVSFIPVTGLRGKGGRSLLKAPWRLLVSLGKALQMLKRHQPVCVLGMGGYVTGPGGVAAKLLGIPLVVHEQNAIAGLTNKWLARIAKRVLQAFPDAFAHVSGIEHKVVLTGNPVRQEIAAVQSRQPHKALRLLVVGGSRGALAINEMIPRVVQQFGEQIDVWHQTGKATFDQCQAEYGRLGVSGRVAPFIDDMAKAYEWADLVVCRCGALTVAELAAAGRPAILIPFPHAVDDHQTVNGCYLVDRGAALMEQQKDLNAERLTRMIKALADNPAKLDNMAVAAKAAGLPAATCDVVRNCIEVAGQEVTYA